MKRANRKRKGKGKNAPRVVTREFDGRVSLVSRCAKGSQVVLDVRVAPDNGDECPVYRVTRHHKDGVVIIHSHMGTETVPMGDDGEGNMVFGEETVMIHHVWRVPE